MLPSVPAARFSDHIAAAGYLAPSRHRRLTSEEMHAVVTRNSIGSVRHALADGAVRTTRVRYVRDEGAIYLPAWTSAESWYAAPLPAIECDVSEVDWHSCWRYVWLRGHVTPLQPTGATREREAWRRGVAVLRQRITNMAATDELALANFGIVRMEMESWDGVMVPWGEVARASGPVVTNP